MPDDIANDASDELQFKFVEFNPRRAARGADDGHGDDWAMYRTREAAEASKAAATTEIRHD